MSNVAYFDTTNLKAPVPVGTPVITPDTVQLAQPILPGTYTALGLMTLIMVAGVVLAFRGHKATLQSAASEDQGTHRPLNQFERIMASLVAVVGTSILYLLIFPGDGAGAGRSTALAAVGVYFGTKSIQRQRRPCKQWLRLLTQSLHTKAQRIGFLLAFAGMGLLAVSVLLNPYLGKHGWSGWRYAHGPLYAIDLLSNGRRGGASLGLFWLGTAVAAVGVFKAYLSIWLWQPLKRWINQA